MEFYKYHSLGNDYLVFDCQKNKETLNQEKYPKSVIEILVLVQMELLRAHIWMEKRCM